MLCDIILRPSWCRWRSWIFLSVNSQLETLTLTTELPKNQWSTENARTHSKRILNFSRYLSSLLGLALPLKKRFRESKCLTVWKTTAAHNFWCFLNKTKTTPPKTSFKNKTWYKQFIRRLEKSIVISDRKKMFWDSATPTHTALFLTQHSKLTS